MPNTVNEIYVDRVYELWRLIYLSIGNIYNNTNNLVGLPNITTPVVRGVSSATLTGTGSTTSGAYRSVRFYNPDTNGASVTINGVPLVPGASRTYSVEKPDYLGAISYNAGTQTIYVEYIS